MSEHSTVWTVTRRDDGTVRIIDGQGRERDQLGQPVGKSAGID